MVGRTPKRIPLSDQIRQAVESSGISQYRLSKEVQIGKTSLSRFMRGERGLTLKALDRLADFLELEIVVRPKRRRKRSN
jgi:transcriptional regulator with XRE-family HTH domain